MTFIANTTMISSNITVDSATWFLQFSLWPLRLVCPLLIVLCPASNWACIRIFQSRIYARSSSKWYFIYIAIFDTIYVFVTAPLIFLISLDIYILNWHRFLCKSIVFLNYLSCQIAAGLLACLSIDRLVATTCLSLYRQNCSTHISKIVCLGVILMFSIVNSHYLIGYTIDSHGYCSVRHYKWYEANYSLLNVVYLLSYSIIPFTIITICNFLIVLSVCQNKTNMKKKYEKKKLKNQREQRSNQDCPEKCVDKPMKILRFVQFSPELTSMEDKKRNSSLLFDRHHQLMPNPSDPNGKWEEFSTNSMENQHPSFEHKQIQVSLERERSLSTSLVSSSLTSSSQKMCIQLQITISLLAVSICFIFCTLPNCISTIMIQTYANNEQMRKFWQAMNYLSIVPLLITHSVNLVFYYLSSNMFRERFKEYYLNKRTR